MSESDDNEETLAQAEMEMMASLKRKTQTERAGSPKKQKLDPKKVEDKKPQPKKPEPKQEHKQEKKPEPKQEQKHEKKHEEKKEAAQPKVKKLPSGLQYEDVVVGTGPKAKKGKRVAVRCT